jgi:hypothetical protein
MEKEFETDYETPRMESIELDLEGVILDGASAGDTEGMNSVPLG